MGNNVNKIFVNRIISRVIDIFIPFFVCGAGYYIASNIASMPKGYRISDIVSLSIFLYKPLPLSAVAPRLNSFMIASAIF